MTDIDMNNLAGVDKRIARVEGMLRAQSEQIQMSQRKQAGSLYNVSASPELQPSTSTSELPKKSTHSDGLGIRVTPCLVNADEAASVSAICNKTRALPRC